MSNDRQKVFLLGVGCQKGGTTWLHDYLSSNPEVDFGFLKEYHVFDALTVPECKHFVQRKVNALKYAINSTPSKLQKNLLKQVEFYLDPGEYFNYFDTLYRQNPEVSLVGDITPAYCGLPESTFDKIKRNLERKGFRVKVIFLMRDPFERIWSHLRMQRKYAKKGTSTQALEPEQHQLLTFYSTQNSIFRTRYELTVKRLENVFPSEDIHYEFYENLFNEDSIRKITDFLFLPYVTPDLAKFVNASPKGTSTISENCIREVVNFYSETYEFCQVKFGRERVSEYWKNARLLDSHAK